MKSWVIKPMRRYLFLLCILVSKNNLFSIEAIKKKYEPPIKRSAVYISLVQKQSMNLLKEHCSGVLVSQKTVITTAHCFDPIKNQEIYPHNIFLGKQKSNVEKFMIHPKYKDNSNIYMDIAIIKLKKALINKKNIVPILSIDREELQSSLFFFGLSGKKGKLFRTKEKILFETQQYMANFDGVFDTRKYLIFSDGLKLARPGDSGGPVYVKHNKKWYIYGVILENSAFFTPEISTNFIKLKEYMTWITSFE